ncbi:MAG: hypothetical protein PVF74_15470 [Anaerolineales bacterium]
MNKSYRLMLIVMVIILLFTSACQSSATPEAPPEVQPDVQVAESIQEEVAETDQPYPPPPIRPINIYNPYPGPSEGVNVWTAWEDAVVVINSGEVIEVYQAETLHVTLVLGSGTIILAKEPEIDEVFRIIEECGEPCSGVIDKSE